VVLPEVNRREYFSPTIAAWCINDDDEDDDVFVGTWRRRPLEKAMTCGQPILPQLLLPLDHTSRMIQSANRNKVFLQLISLIFLYSAKWCDVMWYNNDIIRYLLSSQSWSEKYSYRYITYYFGQGRDRLGTIDQPHTPSLVGTNCKRVFVW